ncbi:MAG: hypothetical protein GY705_19925, partial [Bacteroidetes bacterium]|nr:hypothetical protein [Bacteroidota bacterium]
MQRKGAWKRYTSRFGSSDQPAAKPSSDKEFFLALACYLPVWDGFQCGNKSGIEESARNTKDALRADSAIAKVVEIVHSVSSSTFPNDYGGMVMKYPFSCHAKLQVNLHFIS